jgi:hypothetical protein
VRVRARVGVGAGIRVRARVGFGAGARRCAPPIGCRLGVGVEERGGESGGAVHAWVRVRVRVRARVRVKG